MNKVLFSPVGMTDPVRCNRDGPLLHIIRHYRPDKVYLFFTSETEELEKTDGRYCKSIKKAGFDCRVETIFSSIGDPSDFDAFMKAFPETLKGIAEENPGTQLLVNISSGTSQMISALCLEIASNRYDLLPIQVKTPERKSIIARKGRVFLKRLMAKEFKKNFESRLRNTGKSLSYIDYGENFREAFIFQAGSLAKATEENDPTIYRPVIMR